MKSNKFYRFLTSIRLAIILLVIIVVLCVVYTIVPQNQPMNTYIDKYGNPLAAVITLLGLDHVFSSPWAYITVPLFMLNLGLCTLGRFTYARGRSKKSLRLDAWGSPVLHVGLCLVIIGTLISSLMGKKEYLEIPEGASTTVVTRSGPRQIIIDDVEVEYYEDGITPRQYRSSFTLEGTEGNAVALSSQVNSPARYDGTSFLQQSFGYEVSVTLSTGTSQKTFTTTKEEEWFSIYGTEDNGVMLGVSFYPEYEEEGGAPVLKSMLDVNPRLLYMMTEGDNVVASGILSPGETRTIEAPLTITFDTYNAYTGMQVKYDPGIKVIFAGFRLCVIGLLMRYLCTGLYEQKDKTTGDQEKGKES